MIRKFIYWVLPEYAINDLVVESHPAGITDYCINYCRKNGFKYLDWFFKKEGGIIIRYEFKSKG